MEIKKEDLENVQVIAAVPPPKKHESRLRMDQAIEREVQDATTRKQFEIAAALAKAGVPINEFPDTPEGAAQLGHWMTDHAIEVHKLVFEDDFWKSGYYIYRAKIEVAFVPCEIVRGVMI